MARRELLMLAKVYDPAKNKIGGWYMSEKLDGTRCFWDGGVSRGADTASVPWASTTNPKTGEPKKVKATATGLWSRYGNPICAPEWFLNQLPCCPLDGELYAGRGNFQLCRSIVGKHEPVDDEWEKIQYAVFSTPDFSVFLQEGEIKNANQLTVVSRDNFQRFAQFHRPHEDWRSLASEKGPVPFSEELATLADWIDTANDVCYLIPHTKLPTDHGQAAALVQARLQQVLQEGGEGLVLRCPDCQWTPKRVATVLKVKGRLDETGVVTGFTAGKGKHAGRIGALVLDYKGKRLELSGMTDEERRFLTAAMAAQALNVPGKDMPEGTQGAYFEVGDAVDFTYREMTDAGIPKEARLLRKREAA